MSKIDKYFVAIQVMLVIWGLLIVATIVLVFVN